MGLMTWLIIGWMVEKQIKPGFRTLPPAFGIRISERLLDVLRLLVVVLVVVLEPVALGEVFGDPAAPLASLTGGLGI